MKWHWWNRPWKTELPNVAINLMSMFAPIAQNRPEIDLFSFQAATPPALSYFMFPFIENIGFVVSRHPSFSPSVGSRGCTWRPHFFSSRSVLAKIHADFSRGPPPPRVLALARPPSAGKKNKIQKNSSSPDQPLFPRQPLVAPLFSFCRRCPTWRYVKRIYNWRYDGRALESNTSILIPATPTPRIQTIPPTRPCHFRGNPSNVKAHPGRSAFTVWILNLYRTVERTSEKYAGRDEQKRIFLGDWVAPLLPIVFQLTILYFAISILHIWLFTGLSK